MWKKNTKIGVSFCTESAVHESTEVTPAELTLQRPLKGPLDASLSPRLCNPDALTYLTDSQITELWKFVKANLEKAKLKQKHNYDK